MTINICGYLGQLEAIILHNFVGLHTGYNSHLVYIYYIYIYIYIYILNKNTWGVKKCEANQKQRASRQVSRRCNQKF